MPPVGNVHGMMVGDVINMLKGNQQVSDLLESNRNGLYDPAASIQAINNSESGSVQGSMKASTMSRTSSVKSVNSGNSILSK